MKLNCDLGESFGHWKMGQDTALMPLIDQANIACGFHAGDPQTIRKTIRLAKKHGVSIGAHPGYPDLQGFGRRSMAIEADELIALLHYQIAAVSGMAQSQGTRISHVKPHGALYNNMMANEEIFKTVLRAMQSFHLRVPLIIQATVESRLHSELANEYAVELLFEAFADRRYQDNGLLMSRQDSRALLSLDESIQQAMRLIRAKQVLTVSGMPLDLHADTLCIHGDSAVALSLVKAIREYIKDDE